MILGPDDDPPGRVRIKICGITHPADAALAAELGADALGLNFYEKSPRALDLARDGGWLRALPAGIRRIAVLVNAPLSLAERLVGEGIADAVQLHGDEDEVYGLRLKEARVPFIKAIRVRDETALQRPERFGTDHLLLDAFRPTPTAARGTRSTGPSPRALPPKAVPPRVARSFPAGWCRATSPRRCAVCGPMPWTWPAAWRVRMARDAKMRNGCVGLSPRCAVSQIIFHLARRFFAGIRIRW